MTRLENAEQKKRQEACMIEEELETHMSEVEYTLTLDKKQARETLKAVELLMRLKINQPKEISWAILDGMDDRLDIDEYCKRKDEANVHLEQAFKVIFPTWDEVKKDAEWYRLYNLYQAIRYAIHEAEHPETTGVDSYPPIRITDEPIPKCEWKIKETEMKSQKRPAQNHLKG